MIALDAGDDMFVSGRVSDVKTLSSLLVSQTDSPWRPLNKRAPERKQLKGHKHAFFS